MSGQILFTTIQNLVLIRNATPYTDEETNQMSATIKNLVGKLNETIWAKENEYVFRFRYNSEDDEFEVYEINNKI